MSMDISAFIRLLMKQTSCWQTWSNTCWSWIRRPRYRTAERYFRAAHSIKGGAATFGFSVLQETTHLLENLLDGARREEMRLSTEIINLFLETKDIMQEQLDAYKTSQQPDAESFDYICRAAAAGAGSAAAGRASRAARRGPACADGRRRRYAREFNRA